MFSKGLSVLVIGGQNKEKGYDPQTEPRIMLIPKLT